MLIKEIMALPVQNLIHPEGCHLYLWTTNTYLPDALQCMRNWGFTYKNIITWYKPGNIGLGQYLRNRTEHCLFGVCGKLPYKIIDGKRCQGVTGFIAERREHSRKPDEMRQMIERVSYAPRIELFAREAHEGWDCLGYAVDGRDIKEILETLTKNEL